MNTSSDATFFVTETKLVVRRVYSAPSERVFQAWVDPADLGQWFCPGADWSIDVDSVDLRIGGAFSLSFAPPGETPFVETGAYREIRVPDRLAFTTALRREGALISLTDCDIGFLDLGGTTEVTLIETGGDRKFSAERAEGWGATLDNLHRVLN